MLWMNLQLGQLSANVRLKFGYSAYFNLDNIVKIGWMGLGLPFSFLGIFTSAVDTISFSRLDSALLREHFGFLSATLRPSLGFCALSRLVFLFKYFFSVPFNGSTIAVIDGNFPL